MNNLISGFLYNVSLNCNDLLFIHLFSKSKGINIKLSKNKQVKIPSKTSFPFKWLYAEIIKNFDISSDRYNLNIFLEQSIVHLEENGVLKKQLFFQTILDFCKELDCAYYEKAYIYKKCCRILDNKSILN